MLKKPNLMSLTYFQVKKLAKELCEKDVETLSEETGIGLSHLRRHFAEPGYNVNPSHLVKLCSAMGNWLQIEWIVIQAGGSMVMLDQAKPQDLSVSERVSKTLKEASDLLHVWSGAMLDGIVNNDEADSLDRELGQLIKRANETREAIGISIGARA